MRTRRHLLCLLLTLEMMGSACVPDFRPASELGDEPQVLAVRATPPEAAPGEEVLLDALIHWPGATPSLGWLICVPGMADDLDTCVANRFTTFAEVARCEDDPWADLCLAGTDATALYRVPEQEEQAIYVQLVATSLSGGLERCADAVRTIYPTQDCALSVKRLTISESSSRNQNPVLLPLSVNGETVDASTPHVLGPGDADLAVNVEPDSVDELGVGDPLPDEVRLPVLWYATCGSLGDDGGNVRCAQDGECVAHETRWSPDTSGECTVHVVVRDRRGGVAWITREFIIQ